MFYPEILHLLWLISAFGKFDFSLNLIKQIKFAPPLFLKIASVIKIKKYYLFHKSITKPAFECLKMFDFYEQWTFALFVYQQFSTNLFPNKKNGLF